MATCEEYGVRISSAALLDTIMAAANLGVIYQAQDQWREAEKMEMDVLEQRKRIIGNEHPRTILAAANLAAT
jgi:hypothetical protein